MARFYGNSPCDNDLINSVEPCENYGENREISREVFIENAQEAQAALVVCNEINAEVKNLRMEVASLHTTIEQMKSSAQYPADGSTRAASKKLPKGLPAIVRELQSKMTNKFEASELFGSPHNKAVADELIQQIESHNRQAFTKASIKCSVHRYYESRRRIFNDCKSHRQNQVAKNRLSAKRKGYRKRLYQRREKMVKTDRERVKWKQIDENYMTAESSDGENDTVRCHHLPWESDDLQKMKENLDQRIRDKNILAGRYACKPRVESTPSTLPIPHNPVKWAVKTTSERNQHDNISLPSPSSISQATSVEPLESTPTSSLRHSSNLMLRNSSPNVATPLATRLSSSTPHRYYAGRQDQYSCRRYRTQNSSTGAAVCNGNSESRREVLGSHLASSSSFRVRRENEPSSRSQHMRENSHMYSQDRSRSSGSWISPSMFMQESDASDIDSTDHEQF